MSGRIGACGTPVGSGRGGVGRSDWRDVGEGVVGGSCFRPSEGQTVQTDGRAELRSDS